MQTNKSSENIGECGICQLTGPLEKIQEHFLNTHVTKEDNATPNSANEETRWAPHQVILLIRLVEENFDKFNNTLKKNVWIHIASQLSTITGKQISYEQVDNKWKGLKKTYKKIKDHNNKTGNNTATWEFFDAMDTFMGRKPEINPVAVCDTTNGLRVNEATTSKKNDEQVNPTQKRPKRASDCIQKRHEEKMARFDEFLHLYRQSVMHQMATKDK